MRLNRSHMKYIPRNAVKSIAKFCALNPTPVFRSTYSKTGLVLFANEFRLTVFCSSKRSKFQDEVRFAEFVAAAC
jgi:hypothetical protein